jgi:tetratricopeptide (TPR) repeat protein
MIALLVTWRRQLHDQFARLLLRLHRYEAAANAYARALRVGPDDAHLRFQRAWSLLEVPHRRLESIAAFEELMTSSPSGFGYFLLACAFQAEERHEEAVRAFQEAVRLGHCEDADFHKHRGYSLHALGRFDEALEACQTAAHLDPVDADAWAGLAATLVELDRWRDAAHCQQRAMRLAPDLERGLGLFDILYELNRLDEAERTARECLAIDPRSTDAKERLAVALADQDRLDDAMALALELCAVRTAPVSSRVVLAGVLLNAERLDEALAEARAAAEAAPSDPRPDFVLGFIYGKMNDGEAALAAFERVQAYHQNVEPCSTSTRAAVAVGRGNALSVLDRHDEAMSAFEEGLRLAPGYFERWPKLASHYQRSSREIQRRGRNSAS